MKVTSKQNLVRGAFRGANRQVTLLLTTVLVGSTTLALPDVVATSNDAASESQNENTVRSLQDLMKIDAQAIDYVPPTPAPSSGNLVFNGNFDLRITGWRQGEQAQWTGQGVPTEEPNNFDSKGFPQYYAGRVGDGDDAGRLSQTITVVPHQQYDLSAMIAVLDGKAGQAGVSIGGIPSNYNVDAAEKTLLFDYSDEFFVTTNGAFQNVSLSFNSGESDHVTIFFDAGQLGNLLKPIGHLVFDNVMLFGPLPADYIDPFSVFDWSQWEIDGLQPVQPTSSLRFDALESCTLFSNGDGCIHEAKTLQTSRVLIQDQFESLSYTATMDVSVGVETVVTRWFDLASLYVADVSENAPNFFTDKDSLNGTRWLDFSGQGGDGIANNGVFDVFVAFRDPVLTNSTTSNFCNSGVVPEQSYSGIFAEKVFHLGTVQSGEAFDFYGQNDHGEFLINVTIRGETKTASMPSASRTSSSSLWFGSYDQARDMETMERFLSCGDQDTLSTLAKSRLFHRWYDAGPDRKSAIEMTKVEHVRNVDAKVGNLVFNGDFNLRITGWRQGEQAQWTGEGVPTDEADNFDSDGFPQYYAGRVGDGDDAGRLSQTIAVVPNEHYELSAMIAVLEGKAGQAGVVVGGTASNFNVDDALETLYFEYSDEFFNSSTVVFQEVSLSFNSQESDHVTIFFDAGEFGNTTKPIGHLIFDNVELLGPLPEDYVDPFSVFDWSQWEIDGGQPVQPSSTLRFDAIDSCTLFSNGDGCIHEAKTLQTSRALIQDQFESLSYTATMDVSGGVETVVTRWFDLATVYVADVSENAPNFFTNNDPLNGTRWLDFSGQGGDGIASNGVFDVFVAFRDPVLTNATTSNFCNSGILPEQSYSDTFAEHVVHFGTIESGEAFEFYGHNDHGEFLMNITIRGVTKTASMPSASRTSTSSLWFGSYDQARDMETLERFLSCEDKDNFGTLEKSRLFLEWYGARPDRRAAVEMVNVEHFRSVDPISADLVFNGNFDLRITGWRQGEQAQWTGEGVPTDEPDNLDSEGVPQYYAGRVGDGDDAGRLSQTITVVPNQQYELSATIAVLEGKAGQAGVSIGGFPSNYNVDGATQTLFFDYSDEFFNSSTVVFQNVSLAFNSGDSDHVTIFFDAGEFGSTAKPIGHLIFDNVALFGPLPDDYVDPFSVFDWSAWEIDGVQPVQSASTLRFDALDSCTLFSNGDGCIHEAKTLQTSRVLIQDQFEALSYTATMDVSAGVEVVVTRWFDLATVYVADVSEDAPNFFTNNDPFNNGTRWLDFSGQGGDGIANNGVFDVFVAFRDPVLTNATTANVCSSGDLPEQSYSGIFAEKVVHFGTIESGEAFDFYGQNDHGAFLVNVTIRGETKTARMTSANRTSTSSLWFGAYDQARDMETLSRFLSCSDKEALSTLAKSRLVHMWYGACSDRRSAIEMEKVEHVRVVD